MNTIKDRFALLREELDITQEEMARRLKVSRTHVTAMENGKKKIIPRTIKNICDEFGISEVWLRDGAGPMYAPIETFEGDAKKLIETVKDFNDEDLEKFMNFLKLVMEYRRDMRKQEIRFLVKTVKRPIYELKVSAGTGAFLDGTAYHMEDFPEDEVPENSTFGVVVSGDSMEPEYHDGQTVFAVQTPDLEDGDIGIVILNGEGFMKQVVKDGKKCILRSLNDIYEDIYISPFDTVKTVGKVLS